MSSFWDEFGAPESAFVRFEMPGDKLQGRIVKLEAVDDKFTPGKLVPQITVRDEQGNDRVLSVNAYDLKSKLARQRPFEGDDISIVYAERRELDNGKSLKVFEVKIRTAAQREAAESAVRETRTPPPVSPKVEPSSFSSSGNYPRVPEDAVDTSMHASMRQSPTDHQPVQRPSAPVEGDWPSGI